MIETTQMTGLTLRLPGLNGALRIWSAARALLALLGLAVVLAAALPAPRDALLRQLAAWSEAWDEQASSVAPVSAGTIQPGTGSPALRADFTMSANRSGLGTGRSWSLPKTMRAVGSP